MSRETLLCDLKSKTSKIHRNQQITTPLSNRLFARSSNSRPCFHVKSPSLYNLYLNELPFSLEKTKFSDPLILPDGTKLNTLLYADDLIILSHGLQNSLNTLNLFCKSWKLDVNLKKTKVMIFQNKTRTLQNQRFYLGDHLVEKTQEYTYLGVKLTSNGNFTAAKKQLSEKGLHALFGMRKYSNINRFPPKLASKIFDSMISPILTYNCEVWGAYLKLDLNHWDKSPIEKVHLRFCKSYLQSWTKVLGHMHFFSENFPFSISPSPPSPYQS